MTNDKSNDILKSVLEKRRNCIPLNTEEQKYVDETFKKLFDKKFGSRVFITRTGEEIRKDATSTTNKEQKIGAEKDKAISDERSEFGKEQKIANDDNSGAVKATEDGEHVDVDEKKTGNEAEHVNASDITHADNDDDQRKPVAKFAISDVVVKSIGGGKSLAGVILKVAEKEQLAFVKWASGTFSYVHMQDLVKLADALANIAKADHDCEAEHPGMECPGKPEEKPAETAEIEKAPVVGSTGQDKPAEEAKPESEEKPADEAKETPKEQAAEQAAGTEEHAKPSEEELAENEWFARCEKSVGANGNVEDSKSICMFVRTTMKKSGDKIVKIDREEIRKSNPKLAEQMDKDNHASLNFDTEKFEQESK